MEITSKAVIENITIRMKAMGLNQRQLALKANIPPEYLNRLFKGHGGIGMKTAEKLATAMGCSVDDLFVRTVESEPTGLMGLSHAQLAEMYAELVKRFEAIQNDPFWVAYGKAEPLRRSLAMRVLTSEPGGLDRLQEELAQKRALKEKKA